MNAGTSMRRDPVRTSLWVLAGLGASGLVAIVLGWRGVDSADTVATQVDFVVSGGLGGCALIGFGSGLYFIQARRQREAALRAQLTRAIIAVESILVPGKDA